MDILNKGKDNFKAVLTCAKCAKCPIVSIGENVTIEDDYNSSITMSRENFTELANQIRLGAFDDYI